MNQADEVASLKYPHGRGYGHDYMRGGEVLGGYGYAERDEYAMARGDLTGASSGQRTAEATHERNDIRT